jgi:hypothetical protein
VQGHKDSFDEAAVPNLKEEEMALRRPGRMAAKGPLGRLDPRGSSHFRRRSVLML